MRQVGEQIIHWVRKIREKTSSKRCYVTLQTVREWVQVFSVKISGIGWVDNMCNNWFIVEFGYYSPIITKLVQ